METQAQTTPVASGDGISHHLDEIASSATHIVDESRRLAKDVADVIDMPGRMERHPYQTLLIAAGVGYVLGGGLLTSLTATLLRGGVRVAAVPMVRQQLLRMVTGTGT
jgi:ElaB/YqjD/DUF883 family membrane-anchored ribosome-binding protein